MNFALALNRENLRGTRWKNFAMRRWLKD